MKKSKKDKVDLASEEIDKIFRKYKLSNQEVLWILENFKCYLFLE